MLSILVAACVATPPVCHTSASYTASFSTGGYRTNYVATPFVNAQGYANYGHHANQVVTAFIPVVQQPYQVEIVGDAARAQQFAAQQLQAQANLVNAITSFGSTLEKFRVQVAAATGVQAQAQAAQQQAQTPAQAVPTTPAPASPPQPPVPASEPPAASQGAASPNAPPSQAKLAASQVLARRCASCHTGEAASGGFTIFASKGVLANLSLDAIRTIDNVAYSGAVVEIDPATGSVSRKPMPPNGKGMSGEEYGSVRAWLFESSLGVAAK